MTAVMPSAMGIWAQGIPMQHAQEYKINPALRNPQQPIAWQPMPTVVSRAEK